MDPQERLQRLLDESRTRSPLTVYDTSTPEGLLERSRVYGIGGPLDTITRTTLTLPERRPAPFGYF